MRRLLLVIGLALAVVGGAAGSASAGTIKGGLGGEFPIPPVFRGLLTFGDASGGGNGVFVPTKQPFNTVFNAAGTGGVTTIYSTTGQDPVVFNFNITCVDVESVGGSPVVGYTTQLTGVQGPAVVVRNLPPGAFFANRVVLSKGNRSNGKTATASHLLGYTDPANCSPINGPESEIAILQFSLASSGAFGSAPGQFPYALGYLESEPAYACNNPSNKANITVVE